MNRKLTIAVSAALALVGMVTAFEWSRHGSASPDSTTESDPTFERSTGWKSAPPGTEPAPGVVSPGYRSLERLVVDSSHPVVEFVDGETGDGRRAMVLVGAPGIWPPATLTADRQGVLYLPHTDIETLGGETFRQYELVARAVAKPLAYWGVVDFGRRQPGEGGSRREVELRRASPVRLKVVGPDGTPIDGARVSLTRGDVGFVTLDKRTGPEGRTRFRAIPSGAYVASASLARVGTGEARFEHGGRSPRGITISLDSPPDSDLAGSPAPGGEAANLEVRLEGLSESAWRSATLRWREPGGTWRHGTLLPGNEGSRIWRKRVPSTPVELRLETEGGASASKTIGVEATDEPAEWQVDLRARHAVYVTDAYGAPVRGAVLQVWRGGDLVKTARSRADRAVEFRLDRDAGYALIAFDSQRGETRRRIEPGTDTSKWTLSVDRPLFSVDFPVERLQDPARMERLLEVPLVRDGDAWLVDARGGKSRAVRSGLERGDRLMSIHRPPGEPWRLVVDRDGQIVRTSIAPDG